MAYSISQYFSDEELESQLRLQYGRDEMWTIDFRALFSQIVDVGECLRLQIKGRTFNIDKVTGSVSEVSL